MKVSREEENIRLDIYLSKKLNESRNLILKNIKKGNIKVNNCVSKASYLVKENDEITFDSLKEENIIKKEDIPLDIIYEDEYIIVVNKKSGMVVHPSSGNYSATLVNALMNYTNQLSDESGEFRAGIVHRIDKDTSGLLLIAKTNEAHKKLIKEFKNKNIVRKYIALVHGVIKENKGKIDAPIGRDVKNRKKMCVTENNSKNAVTYFKVLKRYNNATLLELKLETGRTHQIRVHMNYIGYPVVNDKVYGRRKVVNDFGQMLHAHYLAFNHPITNEYIEFATQVPNEFNEILDKYKV